MENGKRIREDENKFKSVTKDIVTSIVCICSKIKFKILYMIGQNRIADSMCTAIRRLCRENEYQREILKEIVDLCESNLYGKPEIRLQKIKEIANTFPNE